jgi:hypothetical protein
MNQRNYLQSGFFYFAFSFCLLYILFFPVPYYLLPNVGSWFTTILNPFIEWLGDLVGIKEPFTRELWSDSTGHYLFTGFLIIFSLVTSIIFVFVSKKPVHPKLVKWFHIFLSYYLALTLLKYGADKIFKHQFYLPEPNTLFTPVGQLTPDMLFWSTMGSSYSYTVFSGIIEIIPALFLLFRKTRLLGILISFAVLVNVVMLNFGFDITVKIYSLFLLLITVFLLAPYMCLLFAFFVKRENVTLPLIGCEVQSKSALMYYTLTKTFVIGLLIYESTGFYFATGNLNDDLSPKSELYGAYDVYLFTDNGKIIPASMSYPGRFRRVFFHRRDYFIVQTMDDKFIDYNVLVDKTNKTLTLYNSGWPAHHELTSELTYQVQENSLVIYGYFFDSFITLFSKKIDLKKLPLLNEKMHWTIDGF